MSGEPYKIPFKEIEPWKKSSSTTLDWNVFAPKFGTWAPKIEPFFMSGGMDKIYSHLKKESKLGTRIAPDSADVFKCFRSTPYESLRVVICGICPYHSTRNNIAVADGLALSCSKTMVLQPSLEQLYDALEKEFASGMCLPCIRTPDLSYLAEQGVLLFNAALTTKIGEPRAHQDLWAPFTQYVFQHIISYTGVPCVFLGSEAADFEGWLGMPQSSFCLSHPASASYRNEKWDSKGVFKQVNDILMGANGEAINWLMEEPPF